MTEAEKEILTAQEVADHFRLDVVTIYRLAKAGAIPATKIGRTWRFDKSLVDAWFRERSVQGPSLLSPSPSPPGH